VRTLVRSARDLYHGSPRADRLHALARALDGPPRIAVVGPPVPAVAALTEGLAAGTPACTVRRVEDDSGDAADAGVPAADAWVLVADGARPADLPLGVHPTQAVGVLLRGDPTAPAVTRRCQAVVALAAGDADPTAGTAAVQRLVDHRLLPRVEALRVRDALAELEATLQVPPPRGDARPLRYQLDAVRSAAQEVAELDLLDALCSGELRVADEQRRAAEVLLGADGLEASARLRCSSATAPQDLARAAVEQLARWQRVAAHPATPGAARRLAGALVQTCERLLSASAER